MQIAQMQPRSDDLDRVERRHTITSGTAHNRKSESASVLTETPESLSQTAMQIHDICNYQFMDY
jgi:hypothetical protein